MSGKFLDLPFIDQCFRNCLKEEDDIIIDVYLEGYNELVRFLNLIGTVFSFVSSDVKSKVKIMEKHRTGEDSTYYESFKKMMQYELEAGLLDRSDFVSGSRTMLRLHRGLAFIRAFMKRLNEADVDCLNTAVACQLSYNETLSDYHPWYIKKAASLAMYTLPARTELMMKVFGTGYEVSDAMLVLPDMLRACDEVYRRVQQLYTDFDLHGLP